ncbi:MAG: acylphosphatase [Gammaproteobacteria bacterium]
MCRRFLVAGRVQGVFFRASTARVATPMGLAGSAVNLADGRVEVTVCGGTDEISKLEQWLANGPPAARVTQVIPSDAPCNGPSTFTTG